MPRPFHIHLSLQTYSVLSLSFIVKLEFISHRQPIRTYILSAFVSHERLDIVWKGEHKVLLVGRGGDGGGGGVDGCGVFES